MTKINKIIFSILIILIVIFLFIFELDYIKDKDYQKQFNYFDTEIIINIKTKSFKKDIIFNNIENLLNKYDKLTSTSEEFNDITNLYKIHHNFIKEDTLTLDKELYDLIEYGINLYDKTGGLIDISKGNIIDIWNSYLITKTGIPSTYELNLANNQSINDIILLNNYQIKNNKVNINLDYIIKGYVLNLVKQYLKDEDISSYYINMDNLVAVGSDKIYKIGLENPDDENAVLKIIEESNKVIAQTSYSEKYYDYNNIRCNNIINFKTLTSTNYYKSVWVISDDSNEATYLSKILFMMDINEGMEYIKNINVKVIWLTLDGEIITS